MIRGTDRSRNIITTIDARDENILGSMFTIDMDESITLHIRHTGTTIDRTDITATNGNLRTAFRIASITATIDATANGDLGLHQQCKHAKQYYGQYLLHYSLFTIHYSLSSLSLGYQAHLQRADTDR